MEVIVLIGIPGSGKSTLAHRHFGGTHLRISRDVVKTANRERCLQYACFALGQPFVADNTHSDLDARASLLAAARGAGFRVCAYFFPPQVEEAARRNEARVGRARVPEAAIRAHAQRFAAPTRAEGFDAIFRVCVDDRGDFQITEIAA